MAPAVVSSAASVVNSILEQLSEKDAAAVVELLIGSMLEPQGPRPLKQGIANQLP